MLLLFWSFAGVGIVADAFMDAITVITSTGKWHTRIDPATGLEKNIHVKKWNATIANLSLMALGSSAPEIMLSIIEIVTGDYYSGPLGPSTIVGSAAFNMLVILAVCVSAPEAGDIRKIKDFSVFGVTAFCSVFAYLWLLFILEGLSGDDSAKLMSRECSRSSPITMRTSARISLACCMSSSYPAPSTHPLVSMMSPPLRALGSASCRRRTLCASEVRRLLAWTRCSAAVACPSQ